METVHYKEAMSDLSIFHFEKRKIFIEAYR
jgi:hypothetical protein